MWLGHWHTPDRREEGVVALGTHVVGRGLEASRERSEGPKPRSRTSFGRGSKEDWKSSETAGTSFDKKKLIFIGFTNGQTTQKFVIQLFRSEKDTLVCSLRANGGGRDHPLLQVPQALRTTKNTDTGMNHIEPHINHETKDPENRDQEENDKG